MVSQDRAGRQRTYQVKATATSTTGTLPVHQRCECRRISTEHRYFRGHVDTEREVFCGDDHTAEADTEQTRALSVSSVYNR
jgi:hypothetical protein